MSLDKKTLNKLHFIYDPAAANYASNSNLSAGKPTITNLDEYFDFLEDMPIDHQMDGGNLDSVNMPFTL